jgi:hypothetical protein
MVHVQNDSHYNAKKLPFQNCKISWNLMILLEKSTKTLINLMSIQPFNSFFKITNENT